MNSKEARQFDMLLRVEDFGTTHRRLFTEPGLATDTFADVAAVVKELAATHLATVTASVSARAERKATARAALHGVLVKASHTAKVLRTRGRTVGPFAVPSQKSDQVLLTVGRQFARDAAAFEADFTALGMPSQLIADTATAFETALRDRGMSRTQFRAGRARTRNLLARAVDDVRALDVIIHNQLPGDQAIQDVWKQARRVEESRARTGGAGEEPAADATNRTTAAAADAA